MSETKSFVLHIFFLFVLCGNKKLEWREISPILMTPTLWTEQILIEFSIKRSKMDDT